MKSLDTCSYSRPRLRNLQANLSNTNNIAQFRVKRRSQTDIIGPHTFDVEAVIAARSKPHRVAFGPLFENNKPTQYKSILQKIVEDKPKRLGILYDRAMKFVNDIKKKQKENVPEPVTRRIIKGVHKNMSFSYSENAPKIRGIRGAKMRCHPVYVDCLREKQQMARYENNNVSLSNELRRPIKSVNLSQFGQMAMTSEITPKVGNKICIRCPIPKMLL